MRAAERSAALAEGRARYSTGKPCKQGHIAERFARNGECVECSAARFARYYADNREAQKDRAKAYYWADHEATRARKNGQRALNADRARKREAAWRAANPERVASKLKRWRKRNPLAAHADRVNRRARKRAAEGRHGRADLRRIYAAQRGRCAICKASLRTVEAHVDHIIPLAAGGSNWPKNIQYLCRHCNLAKAAKAPEVFARERGLLL